MLEKIFVNLLSLLLPLNFSLSENTFTNFEIRPTNIINSELSSIEISASSAIVFDLETSTNIFEKNSEEKKSPASLTKLVTVLTALRDTPENTIYKIPKEALEINGSKNRFYLNQEISLRDLISLSLVESSNQAALAIAVNHSGNEKEFAKEMNNFAFSLGMKNSNFTNSMGFDDYNQYSTTKDLKKLALYAIRHPLLHVLTNQESKEFNFRTGDFEAQNTNQLLTKKLPGFLKIEGLKTGTTPLAGECLITGGITNEGRTIVTVILGSNDRYGDAEKLLELGAKSLRK